MTVYLILYEQSQNTASKHFVKKWQKRNTGRKIRRGEREEKEPTNDEVESEKNPVMAEHDKECLILKNLTTLFHCILLVFSFVLSLSCRTKEKQFCLFNILAANISKRNFSPQEKHNLL
jgi:hypothetical protein